MKPFRDPQYAPPTDLSEAETREYEETIVELLREAMPPGRRRGWRLIESIELHGRRPETVVEYRYREVRNPEVLLAGQVSIWTATSVDTIGGQELLDSAASVGSSIFTAFDAEEFEPSVVS